MIEETFDFAAEAMTQALGEEIEYNGLPSRAVFGSEFQRVEMGDARIGSQQPTATVYRGDVPDLFTDDPKEPETGDQVRIREQDYEVAGVEPGPQGVSFTLRLKRV